MGFIVSSGVAPLLITDILQPDHADPPSNPSEAGRFILGGFGKRLCSWVFMVFPPDGVLFHLIARFKFMVGVLFWFLNGCFILFWLRGISCFPWFVRESLVLREILRPFLH